MDVFDLQAHLGLDTNDFERGLKAAKDGIGALGGLLSGGFKLAVEGATAAVGAVASGLGALGTYAYSVGSSFEASMSKVSAISGAVGDDLAQLEEKALEMGSKTKFSATEAADAMSYMAMAGWKTEEMLGGIEGIMNLAAASGEDLALTSDIVTDALTAFGMGADRAGDFANILAVASSNANTNVSMMGETFKYVAPIAGTLGYTAEDTAFAIGLIANSGIKASMAGTSLRSIFTRLSTDAGASESKLGALGTLTEELGVQFYNTDGSARDLNSVLLDAREAWKNLSQEESTTMAKTIAGQEAMTAWLAIMNASEEDVQKLTYALENADDSAQKMADTMNDNLSGQLTILKSQTETFGISVYKNIQEPLKDVVSVANESMTQISAAFKENGIQGVVDSLGSIIKNFVTNLSGYIMPIADTVIMMTQSVITGISENLPDILSVGISVGNTLINGILGVAVQLVVVAKDIIKSLAKGLADNSNEILTSAAAVIMALVEGVSDALPTVLQAAATIILNLGDRLIELAQDLLPVAAEIIKQLATGIGKNAPDIIAKIVTLATTILETLSSPDVLVTLLEGGIALVEGLLNGILGAIPILIKSVPVIIGNLYDSINQALPKLFEAGNDILTALIGGLEEILPMLLGLIPQFMELFLGAIQDNLPIILEGVTTLLETFTTLYPELIEILVESLGTVLPQIIEIGFLILEALIDGIYSNAPQLIRSVIDMIKQLAPKIVSIQGTFVDAVGKIISALVNALKQYFPFIIGVAKEFFPEVWAVITELYDELSPYVIDFVSGIWETVSTWLSELPSKVWDWLVEVVTTVYNWGVEMRAQAHQTMLEFLRAVVRTLKELPSKTEEWLIKTIAKVIAWGLDLRDKAHEAALNLVENFIQFIMDLPENAKEWLDKAIEKVIEFKDSLIEKAIEAATGFKDKIIEIITELPGKIYDVGVDIVTGLWDGLESMGGWLYDKISGFGDGIIDDFKFIFDINSPSKIMRDQVGSSIAEGIGVGIQKGLGDIESGNEYAMLGMIDSLKGVAFDNPIQASMIARGGVQGATASGLGNANITVNINVDKVADDYDVDRFTDRAIEAISERLAILGVANSRAIGGAGW